MSKGRGIKKNYMSYLIKQFNLFLCCKAGPFQPSCYKLDEYKMQEANMAWHG